MSDSTPPTPPPLPPQPAEEAAAAPPPRRPAYDPATDPDDTGVPTGALSGDVGDVGRGFFRALFDLSFRTFITRRLASVFYIAGLIVIVVGAVLYFFSGLFSGIGALWFNPGGGISLIIATIVLVPLVAFVAVIALRLAIEAVVALIAIAENTERTAENTRP